MYYPVIFIRRYQFNTVPKLSISTVCFVTVYSLVDIHSISCRHCQYRFDIVSILSISTSCLVLDMYVNHLLNINNGQLIQMHKMSTIETIKTSVYIERNTLRKILNSKQKISYQLAKSNAKKHQTYTYWS